MIILKYFLACPECASSRQDIEMPTGSRVLIVKMVDDKPVIWVLCDDNAAFKETRSFFLYFTGVIFTPPGKYIGTFIKNNLVYHLFEKNNLK